MTVADGFNFMIGAILATGVGVAFAIIGIILVAMVMKLLRSF